MPIRSPSPVSQNLTSSVYAALRADLLSGVFPAGARLGIRILQDRYGTGATPVREVLNRLAAEGFVQQIDQKGFRAPRFSREELWDLVRARCLLNEVLFTESIANATDESDEAIIVAHHRVLRNSKANQGRNGPTGLAIDETHRKFHRALIAPCGSRWLIEFNDRLFDQTTRYRALAEPHELRAAEDHRLIMEAVLDRAVRPAIELSNTHIRIVAEVAAEALSQRSVDASSTAVND